jgi:hypothetical protein
MIRLLSQQVPNSSVPWNYGALSCALAISVVLQGMLLQCLCDCGQARVFFALIVDTAVIIRASVAFLRGETGSGWKLYAVLLYTSPLWISILTLIILGDF